VGVASSWNGALDHCFGGRDLVVGMRWGGLDVDDHRVFRIDQIVLNHNRTARLYSHSPSTLFAEPVGGGLWARFT
jgi:hypothetical protein